jgi:hypothetical protein
MIETAEQFMRRGRPVIGDAPKLHIGFRLAADVVNAIRATGKGYNARVEKVLREALSNRFTGEAAHDGGAVALKDGVARCHWASPL